MAKIILNEVNNIDSLTVINDNFDKIEDALQDQVLYRDNPPGEINTIEQDLDFNGFRLINVGGVIPGTESFPGKYLGPFISNPSTGLNGEPLTEGMLYFRTGSPFKALMVWNGSNWVETSPTNLTVTNTIDSVLYANSTEVGAGVVSSKVFSPSVLLASITASTLWNAVGNWVTRTYAGFTQLGTGAIARILQTKLREHVSVKDFGAVGDGVTDDTAAIQAAINAARNIHIPTGQYKTTSVIQIPYGRSIHGDGGTASEIIAYNCDGIRFITYGTSIGDVFIRDFGITSGAGSNWAAVSILNNASTMDGLHFERIRIYGFNEGFNLSSLINSHIRNCVIENINTAIGISAPVLNLWICDNTITKASGGAGSADKIGIDFRAGGILEGFIIDNNLIYGFDIDINIDQALYVNIIGNNLSAINTCITYVTPNGVYSITNNYIETQGKGITGAAQGVDTPTTLSIISDNQFIGATGSASIGIELNTAVGTNQFNTLIENNTFQGFTVNDIKLWSPGKTTVKDNYFVSSGLQYNVYIGGVVTPPIVLEHNRLMKGLFIDIPSDLTNGKILLRDNTVNNSFKSVGRNASPTTDTWEIGEWVKNTEPGIGEYFGWTCTVSGTMGVLNGSATTGSISLGDNMLTLNSITGISHGMYISVAGAVTKAKVLEINGLVVTLDTTASFTVASAAVSYFNATLRPFGLIV